MNQKYYDLLQEREQQALGRFINDLQSLHPQRIHQVFLFGSKARGDSTADSDIDILLIVDKNDWRFNHTISDIASDVSLEHDVLIGPRVIAQERWQRMKKEGFSLYKNIAREGIPLSLESA